MLGLSNEELESEVVEATVLGVVVGNACCVVPGEGTEGDEVGTGVKRRFPELRRTEENTD